MSNVSKDGPVEGPKFCPGCSTDKPRSEFSKNKSRYDGLTNYCKVCWRTISREQYLKRREAIADHYRENREQMRISKRGRNDWSFVPCDQCGLEFRRDVGKTDITTCLPCRQGKEVAHGTATTYGRGCRCRPCTDAASSNAVRNRSRRFREAGMSDDTGHRKRCRKYGGSYEFVRRDDIYERDSWNCGICGEPVDQEAVWPHPLSPSLDHIVPLALGGDHSYANTQCSHLRCNQAKQHRIGQASTL